MLFRGRKRKAPEAASSNGDVAVAREDFGHADEILAEIDRLMALGGGDREPERERRILRLRHLAGIRFLEEAAPNPNYPEPDLTRLPDAPLPELVMEDLTPGVLRAGILRDGCLLVRGAVDADVAQRLAEGIDRAFVHRDAHRVGKPPPDSLYEEFVPEPGFAQLSDRDWIAAGGGVLAVDSPRLTYEMLGEFDRIGLSKLISDYLGEPAAISAEKCTLRKADPAIGGAWHQDGNFLGDVRALNVWLSLSRCGDVAPGLDLVPRRIDHLIEAGTDGALLSYVIAPAKVEEEAGETPIVRPIFEPGDILLFDDLFLHQTGSDPSMPNPRYAIESWFFGASGFPADYAPLAG